MNSKLMTMAIAAGLLVASGISMAQQTEDEGNAAMNQGETKPMNQNREETKVATQTQVQTKALEQQGNGKAAKNQGETKPANQNKVEEKASKQDKSRTETRTRIQPRTSNSSRSNRGAAPSGSRGGSKGGRR